jgi:hypothetical protein
MRGGKGAHESAKRLGEESRAAGEATAAVSASPPQRTRHHRRHASLSEFGSELKREEGSDSSLWKLERQYSLHPKIFAIVNFYTSRLTISSYSEKIVKILFILL